MLDIDGGSLNGNGIETLVDYNASGVPVEESERDQGDNNESDCDRRTSRSSCGTGEERWTRRPGAANSGYVHEPVRLPMASASCSAILTGLVMSESFSRDV